MTAGSFNISPSPKPGSKKTHHDALLDKLSWRQDPQHRNRSQGKHGRFDGAGTSRAHAHEERGRNHYRRGSQPFHLCIDINAATEWRGKTHYGGIPGALSPKHHHHPPPLFMSSTYEENQIALLQSGLSCLFKKSEASGGCVGRKPQRAAGNSLAANNNVDLVSLYRNPQPRTPLTFTPGPSVTTPGHVKLDELPYPLGSTVVDPATGNTYSLVGILGQGTYAFVYQARCEDDGSIYALKCLSKANLTQRQNSLLRAEVELHQKVSPHPNIVRLFSSFENRDYMFLVMERIAGHDLYEYLTNHPRYKNADYEKHRFEKGIRFFEQMLEAVSHIHALKVYHRDLKPENFIVTPSGALKLTDFGLSTKSSMSSDFECGSRPYMSFENRNGGLPDIPSSIYGHPEAYSSRLSDVWALGILFINLMFVESPWRDPSVETSFQFETFLREGPSYLCSRFPKLPKEISDFLCTRVFCPESKRCSVLELKQWARTLGNFFALPKVERLHAQQQQASHQGLNGRHNSGVYRHRYAHNPHQYDDDSSHHNSRDLRAATPLSSYSGADDSPLASPVCSGYAAVSPSSSSSSSSFEHISVPKPMPIRMTRKPQTEDDDGLDTCEDSDGVDYHNQSPYRTPARPKKPALSTSVPAFLFSKIMPVSKIAAAQKAMPRDLNQGGLPSNYYYKDAYQIRIASNAAGTGDGAIAPIKVLTPSLGNAGGAASSLVSSSEEWSLLERGEDGSSGANDDFEPHSIFDMDDEIDFSVPVKFDYTPVPTRRHSGETLSEKSGGQKSSRQEQRLQLKSQQMSLQQQDGPESATAISPFAVVNKGGKIGGGGDDGYADSSIPASLSNTLTSHMMPLGTSRWALYARAQQTSTSRRSSEVGARYGGNEQDSSGFVYISGRSDGADKADVTASEDELPRVGEDDGLATTKSCGSAKTLTSVGGGDPIDSAFFTPSNFDWAEEDTADGRSGGGLVRTHYAHSDIFSMEDEEELEPLTGPASPTGLFTTAGWSIYTDKPTPQHLGREQQRRAVPQSARSARVQDVPMSHTPGSAQPLPSKTRHSFI